MSTSDAELARLRAQAAQAAADAAQAKADAAQAALDAALAAGNSPASDAPPASGNSPAPEDPSASPSDAASAETTSAENPQRADGGASAPSQTDSAEKELGEYAAAVRDGYAFDAPTLTLGAYLEDGTPEPRALVQMPLGMLNRHGLVAGATGTGKTRTLQLMTEGLSASGIPVFITDIKGDLTGLLEPGQASEKLSARVAALGQPWQPASFPVELFSLGGSGDGVPVRTSVTDFGPILMSKVLGLNETQESALSLIFSWADSQGLALIDLADLRATVAYLTSEEGKGELAGIGGVSPATAGVILREISALQAQGADAFFGEPAFETEAFLRTSADGRGVVSCLELPDVRSQPALFSTFQDLPEVGDADKPKLVFFFDEAHLLFADASKEFLNQVVQTVRLIRSKGVGIFFVTQSPKDVPDDVLAQLGSRVQHALRAHTPNDQKALKATVDTFPSSPLDLLKVLPGLGTGEAIVTVLDPKGRPTPVAPTRLWAPAAVMGPSSPGAVSSCLAASPFMAKYKDPVDPESAFELLAARVEAEKAAAETAKEQAKAEKEAEKAAAEAEKRRLKELEAEAKAAAKAAEREEREAAKEAERQRKADERRAERQEKRKEAAIDSVVRSIGRSLGSSITRTLFGSRRR